MAASLRLVAVSRSSESQSSGCSARAAFTQISDPARGILVSNPKVPDLKVSPKVQPVPILALTSCTSSTFDVRAAALPFRFFAARLPTTAPSTFDTWRILDPRIQRGIARREGIKYWRSAIQNSTPPPLTRTPSARQPSPAGVKGQSGVMSWDGGFRGVTIAALPKYHTWLTYSRHINVTREKTLTAHSREINYHTGAGYISSDFVTECVSTYPGNDSQISNVSLLLVCYLSRLSDNARSGNNTARDISMAHFIYLHFTRVEEDKRYIARAWTYVNERTS